MRSRTILILAVAFAVAVLAAPAPSQAFGDHPLLTELSLTTEPGGSTFLRRAVLNDINDEHAELDDFWDVGDDEKHFDDCEFDGGTEFIRDRYAAAIAELVNFDLWGTTDNFGRALHPAQDFYSHSNWVELGFPRNDLAATSRVEISKYDLVDLSGAQSTFGVRWGTPPGGGVVRNDILLANDDWAVPPGWTIHPNGDTYQPTLHNPAGQRQGRLLMTGRGGGDHECAVSILGASLVSIYPGATHDDLNKDGPAAGNRPDPALAHARAAALARLQTSYEWCRLVHEAGLVNREGVLLAMWVRPDTNPHPAHTPCAPDPSGPVPIVVTVERVRVLDSGDNEDDDPGEIQLAAALYDTPHRFHRSDHATSRGERMNLDDGDFVPANRLPRPLSLCLPRGEGAIFALHGWDNNESSKDRFANDFDDIGDDDELLIGVKKRFGTQLPSGTQVASSEDLEVHYRVSRTVTLPFGRRCLPDDVATRPGGLDVQFPFDSAKLTPAAKAELKATAKLIREQAKGPIQVEGHTDVIGSTSYNFDLSQRRAQAVREALARLLSARPSKFSLWGFGPSQPIAANKHPDGSDNPQGRAKNRRVSIAFNT